MNGQRDVERFAMGLSFQLDTFQREAVETIVTGESVLVAAPTGAGKTLIGEFALWLALERKQKAFYTTPIKALSNQKYNDLCDAHGERNVGLLTGDNSINGDAPIVVMTTEVLRNMLYEQSRTLDGLGFVVLDEVHYLGDRSRGAVWEEVIVQLDLNVTIVALSATVSNAEEFGAWLDDVRDGCRVVISEHRPVPLEHHYAIGDRLYPVFSSGSKGRGGAKRGADDHRNARRAKGGKPNPEVLALERQASRSFRVNKRGRRIRTGPKLSPPRRTALAGMLESNEWLPAIVFVFSRQGCDDAVGHLMGGGVTLTTPDEVRKIRRVIERRIEGIDPDDLNVLGYPDLFEAAIRGVAAHHAGMVPAFKEAVEELFAAGLIKIVFATETLALGINMPARTVVIERLEKWNGQNHRLLTPGQFTQLTGRAGRRGKDVLGHVVVNYQRDVEFRDVAGLVGRRIEPLVSQFTPSYNMVLNLLNRPVSEEAERLGRNPIDDALAMIDRSFAQFQADGQTGDRSEEVAKNRAALDGYRVHLTSTYGDFAAYWTLRRELSALETEQSKYRKAAKTTAIETAIAALERGDVVKLDGGRRGHGRLAAVIAATTSKTGTPLISVITDDREHVRIGPREFTRPPLRVGAVVLPREGSHRQPSYRKAIQKLLFDVVPEGDGRGADLTVEDATADRITQLRREIRSHPVHRDPSLHEIEVWAYRYDKLAAETERIEGAVTRRTKSLTRRFLDIVDALTNLGYVNDDQNVTDEGVRLSKLYAETDLVLAECLRWGVTDGLDAADLAAFASLFTHESRRDNDEVSLPPLLERIYAGASGHRDRVAKLERAHRLTPTRSLDPSAMKVVHRWANGADLYTALASSDMTAGDFVRMTKMVADLLRQIRDTARGNDDRLAATAEEANKSLMRGVVTH